MKYLGKGLVIGSVLVLALAFSGCTTTIQDQAQETPGTNAGDITKSSEVLLSGGLFSTSQGKQLIISATDISSGQTKPKTTLVKAGEKVENLLLGQGFVASADVVNLPSNSTNIVNLPEKTKRIKFINDHQLLYLSDTDEFDHARSLSLYDVSTSKSTILYQAQAPWGIDEYVLSPDQTIVALWEVEMPTGLKQLLGGQSKITQVDLKTKQPLTLLPAQQTKNLPTDELKTAQDSLDLSVCLQYPLFYDSKNTLWLDTFCPNAGGLWGAGVYQITQADKALTKNNLLPPGSYSYDPSISKDGNRILVVRPPRNGDASSYGVVYAHSNPATLSVISTSDLTEQKLNTPLSIVFSHQPILSDNGMLTAFSAYANQEDAKNKKDKTIYIADVTAGSTKSAPIDEADDPLVFTRNDQAILLGTSQAQASGVATPISDAGNKYYPVFSGYKVVSVLDPTNTELVSSSSGEFIQTRSAEGAVLAIQVTAETKTDEGSNIKIGAADFRDELSDTRQSQQNNPPSSSPGSTSSGPTKEDCDSVLPGFSSVTSTVEFYELLKKNGWTPPNDVRVATPGTPERAKWMSPQGKMLQRCQFSYKGNPTCADSPTKCYDSPLYLYPQSQQKIEVTSGTSIFSPVPEPLGGRWSVNASPNGDLVVGQKKYDKIAYSYQSDIRELQAGIVTSQANLEPTLSGYADKLGLNQKEKSDFVSFWLRKLMDTPFVQISHYSRAQSADIIKLDINPKPDTYIPIVMYFKKLQFPTVLPRPVFEPVLERKGFTALDWSGIVYPN